MPIVAQQQGSAVLSTISVPPKTSNSLHYGQVIAGSVLKPRLKPCSGLHVALRRPGLLQPHGGRVQLRPGAAGHELRHGLLVPGR